MRASIQAVVAFAFVGLGLCNEHKPVYKDAHASIDARVADLLHRMSIKEKMSQLIQGDMSNYINLTDGSFNSSGLEWNMEYRANSVWTGLYTEPKYVRKAAKMAQHYLVHNTTLGIPAYIQSEGLHGFLALNATIFNSPIGMGCSFNPKLVHQVAGAIGKEGLALGVNQLFAPLADLARELRYGRVEECFGEDPYLVGEIASSFIQGMQQQGVSAMLKHFAAFASPEQGINTAPVHGGERELRSIYLPAYRRAIDAGGVAAIMSSYNSYDGLPVVANSHILTEILRDEWDYQYYVMSDAGGTSRLDNAFHVCGEKDNECITLETIQAGNDAEMGGGYYSFETIPKLIESGKLDIKVLDTAVSRVLRSKFAMGLFEKPFRAVSEHEIKKHLNTEKHRKLARQLDTESIVLLENHNRTLPIAEDAHIAVIGPMAHGRVNYGDYVIHGSMLRGVTPLDGIKAASKGKVTYAKGCEQWSTDESGFAEAVAAAKKADVAVVVVGTWSRDQEELWQGLNATTGEHIDVSSLKLVGAMSGLVKAVRDTGKPTVVVYSSGKPITEPWISNQTSALVQQFYQSQEGGHALADILYGKENPSGKLSVSFPYDVGTLPVYYDYLNSARSGNNPGKVWENGTLTFGSTYALDNPNALYEFGYGLSYTQFEFSPIKASARRVSASDVVTVSVDVTNKGSRDGAEVVQIYVKDLLASVEVPRYQLKGFKKVFVKAGETETVHIKLSVSEWGLWNRKMQYVVEPGDFNVIMGSSSERFHSNTTISVA